MFRFPIGAIVILSILSNLAYAIGDSAGGCGHPSPLQISAIQGTQQQLDTELTKFITEFVELQRQRKWAYAPKSEMSSSALASNDHVRKIFVNAWYGCGNEALLDQAAAAGNIENVNYLLAIGADPSGRRIEWGDFLRVVGKKETSHGAPPRAGSTIFMRCPMLDSDRHSVHSGSSGNRASDETSQILGVYSLLIAAGGNLNALDSEGRSALLLCNHPEAIQFYLANGADPNTGDIHQDPPVPSMSRRALDYRVAQILDNYWFQNDSQLAILKMLLPRIENHQLAPNTIRAIRSRCSDPHNSNVCGELQKLFPAIDQVFFLPGNQGPRTESLPAKARTIERPGELTLQPGQVKTIQSRDSHRVGVSTIQSRDGQRVGF